MSKIATYPSADNPLQLSDRLIGTEAIRTPPTSTPLATKNFSLGELLQLFSSNFPAASLQAVLNTGNTATQNITLVGTIDVTLIKPANIIDTSGSQGTVFQYLSKGASSISWVDLPVSTLQAILNSGNNATQNINLIGNITSTKIIPGNIQDELSGIGTVGQFLSKTATGIKWVNTPTPTTPGLGDVLATGNTAINNINLTGNFTGTSFIKTGGTSLQYLMADGSVTTGGSYTLPVATISILGGVKIGSGINVALDGTISVSTNYQAPLSGSGIVKSASGSISYISGASSEFVKADGSLDSNTYLRGINSSDVTTALGYTPVTSARTLTINGTNYDLSANRSWDVGDLLSSGSYANPSWITSLAYSKLTGTPIIPSVTPSALTKTDDTNVTLTLGGTPSTALLQATSLSLGWTGQLSVSRGGTGSSTALEARTSLGLIIGTDILAYRTFGSAANNNTGDFYLSTNPSNFTSNLGTVTSVAALTLGTTGTDLSSTVANSTTTPVITLNIPTASATNRGALSSADWTTFNNKASLASPIFTGTVNIPTGAIFAGGFTITGGFTSTYVRGDGQAVSFGNAGRAVQLTGLVTGSNTPITATSSILSAFQDTQAQISFLKNRSFGGGSNGATVVNTTTITSVYSQLIPAGTYTTNDVIELLFRTFTTDISKSSASNMYIYISTTNIAPGSAVSGATQLALFTVAGSTRTAQMTRTFAIKGSQIRIPTSSSSGQSDFNLTGTSSLVTIDWTVAQYFIFAVGHTVASTTESLTGDCFIIRKA